MRAVTACLAVLLMMMAAAPGWSQEAPRLALLIGNEAYPGEPAALSYPRRDIARLSAALEATGFETRLVEDADRLALLTAIEAFAEDLRAAGPEAVGFFYYAGHGAVGRSEGARRNFMLPANTRIASETALIQNGVRLDLQIEALQNTGARAVFVVYDACRNEFSRGTRGFEPVSPRTGLLIALSTTDGSTTPDDGRYAAALAEEIARPGQDALLAFARASQTVGAERLPDELPTILPALTGPFCFNGCAPDARMTIVAEPPAAEPEWSLDATYRVPSEACRDRGRACAITALDWRPDGETLAASTHFGLVRTWSLDGGERGYEGHSADVADLSWSPDGERLASVDAAGTLIVWRGDEPPLSATSTAALTAIDWSPDGRRLFAADTNGAALIWDLLGGGPARNLPGQGIVASDVGWRPNGAHVASAGQDGRIRVWPADQNASPAEALVHAGPLYAMAWSPDGNRIAAVGDRSLVRVADLFGAQTGRSVDLVGHFGAVSAVAWSPDGTELATVGQDRLVRIWDVAAEREIAALEGGEDAFYAVAWSPDGQRIAAGGAEGVARVWRREPVAARATQ